MPHVLLCLELCSPLLFLLLLQSPLLLLLSNLLLELVRLRLLVDLTKASTNRLDKPRVKVLPNHIHHCNAEQVMRQGDSQTKGVETLGNCIPCLTTDHTLEVLASTHMYTYFGLKEVGSSAHSHAVDVNLVHLIVDLHQAVETVV